MLDRAGYGHVATRTRELLDALPLEEVRKNSYRYMVRTTSGTTRSEPLLVVQQFQQRSYERANDMRRVIVAAGAWHARLANVVFSVHSRLPVQALTVDIADLAPPAINAINSFGADSVMGFTSFVARVLCALSDEACSRIRRMYLVGEKVSVAHLAVFKRRVPRAILDGSYMSAEFGMIGVRCSDLSLSVYHPAEGVAIECLNPDETGRGSALVSRMIGPIAVKDYFVGDEIRFLPTTCGCGETVTFEVSGRLGFDRLKVAGGEVTLDNLDRVAHAAGLSLDDYRMEVANEADPRIGVRGVLHLQVRSGVSPMSQDEIADFFERRLMVTSRTLRALVESGDFKPLIVSFAEKIYNDERKSLRLVQKDV